MLVLNKSMYITERETEKDRQRQRNRVLERGEPEVCVCV